MLTRTRKTPVPAGGFRRYAWPVISAMAAGILAGGTARASALWRRRARCRLAARQ